MRVLVVDDDPQVARVCAMFLKDDHEVKTATTVADAAGIAMEWGPQLILADVRMRNESGVQLIGMVPSRTRFVFMTGYTDMEGIPEDQTVLYKPFTPRDLKNAVSPKLLDQRSDL